MPRCTTLELRVKCDRAQYKETVLTLAQQAPLPSVRGLSLSLSLVGRTPTLQQQQQLGTTLAAAFPNLERLKLAAWKNMAQVNSPDVLASLAALPRLSYLSVPASLYDDEAIAQLHGLTRIDLVRHGGEDGLAAVGLPVAAISGRPAALGLFAPESLLGLTHLEAPAVKLASGCDGREGLVALLPRTLHTLWLHCERMDFGSLARFTGILGLDLRRQSLELRGDVRSLEVLAAIVRYFSTVAGVRQALVSRLYINPYTSADSFHQQRDQAVAYLQTFVTGSRSASSDAGNAGRGWQQLQQPQEAHPQQLHHQQQQQQQYHQPPEQQPLVVHTMELICTAELQWLLAFLREAAPVVERVELQVPWGVREDASEVEAQLLATGCVREVEVQLPAAPGDESWGLV